MHALPAIVAAKLLAVGVPYVYTLIVYQCYLAGIVCSYRMHIYILQALSGTYVYPTTIIVYINPITKG